MAYSYVIPLVYVYAMVFGVADMSLFRLHVLQGLLRPSTVNKKASLAAIPRNPRHKVNATLHAYLVSL